MADQLRVLLVGASDDVSEELQRAAAGLGGTVVLAASGRDAVTLLRSDAEFSAVVTRAVLADVAVEKFVKLLTSMARTQNLPLVLYTEAEGEGDAEAPWLETAGIPPPVRFRNPQSLWDSVAAAIQRRGMPSLLGFA